jgi:hypothetical protein
MKVMPNNTGENKSLLEEWMPLKETNISSVIEKGFKQARARYKAQFKELFGKNVEALGINTPIISNMHTWFARRPCSASRVLTLASVARSSVPRNTFMEAVGFGQFNNLIKYRQLPILYNAHPNVQSVQKVIHFKHSKEITILDPMAGGGSIPLEAARLGFRTVAVEYNPVAYLILKASVEFPARYADAGLFEETLKASKEFIQKAREESGRYYGEDAENYIFARGVKCPFCGGLISIQGVEPAITKAPRFKKRYLKLTYDKEKRLFSAETTDKAISSGTIAKRGNNIKCPYEGCGKWFQLRGQMKDGTTAFDQWFSEHAQLMENIVEGFTPITSEIEEKLLSLHIPLVKQVGNSFYTAWVDESERKKFTSSLHALSDELFDLQNFIPLDEISTENIWASFYVYNTKEEIDKFIDAIKSLKETILLGTL